MAIKLKKQIHKHPFTLPKGVSVPTSVMIPFEDVSHVPGQNAAIRFFDKHSAEDLNAMREILKGKLVKMWMDDTRQISKAEYADWADTLTDTSFLFAVLDARSPNLDDIKTVRGFVYIYSEREEKFRVRRMEKLGFIKPSDKKRYLLEVSFAGRPVKNGVQSGSGLMSSSLRQSCLQVKMLLSNLEQSEIQIFAFCDQGNIGSQRTVESAGFVRMGVMKYDSDSEDESILYVLNWRALNEKIRARFLEELGVTES